MALLRPGQSSRGLPDLYTEPCRHLAGGDPVIRGLIEQIGPCQLRPRQDYFATLCDSIISQQLSAAAAATICDRFAGIYPRRRPTPVLVAGTRIPKLRAAGLSGQKVGYIKDLAAGFVDGRIRARRLVRQSNEDIIAALTSVKGIGRWTAEMFLIFSLNRLDILPVDDLGIRKAVQRWYGLRGLPEAGRLQAVGRCWSPYESVACWYLWQSSRL